MQKIFATVSMLALLCSCSTGYLPSQQPYTDKSELIGFYFSGDEIAANQTMELHADGTFKNTIYGHLFHTDTYRFGRWKTEGKQIFFFKSDGTYPAEADRLSSAETFYYNGKPAFVLFQDLKKGEVNQWRVFRWEPKPDA